MNPLITWLSQCFNKQTNINVQPNKQLKQNMMNEYFDKAILSLVPTSSARETNATQNTQHSHARAMGTSNNWVIFCKNRWDLRDTVKQVYAVLHTLRVDIAPKKTTIGKASKGFDFLGKRIHPNGTLPSAAALSRMQKNTVQPLSVQKREQGATKKRIGLYWMRWIFWAAPMCGWMVPTTAIGAECLGAASGIVGANLTACICHDGVPENIVSGIAYTNEGDEAGGKSVDPMPPTITTGLHVYTNTASTAVPQQQYSCAWTDGVGFTDAKLIEANIAPGISSDGGGDTANINAAENQTTVTTVTATDGNDDDTITFSISGGDDQAKFSIMGSTGVVTFASTPDFENPTDTDTNNTYVVEVTATDDGAGNLTDTQTLTVTVTDADEPPSNHPTNLSASADSSTAITTTWTDAMTGDIVPENYLLLCSTTNSFTDPTNEIAQNNDTDCADGAGVQNIAQGTQTATWSGLSASTQYFFKMLPSAGSGAGIQYKTDGTPQTADATTSAAATGGGDDGDDTPTVPPLKNPPSIHAVLAPQVIAMKAVWKSHGQILMNHPAI